jgi:cathepsin A (carboxypeptidase C)
VARGRSYKGKVAEQYSGYLDVSTKQGNVNFHYWLTPSQSPTAAKDPLVMWLNGGPGASSILFGFFGELGPYYLDDSSLANSSAPGVPDVYDNPWSWNKIANVLFIETPGNVGYSYCEQRDCRWDDTTGAEANYEALLKFYAEFPEYQENEFFITGESYGGMYVPSLVEQIHNGNGMVPLKGFAVGNGIIGHGDTFPNENGIHYEMLHNHAFISESQWEAIEAECADWFKKSRGSPPASATCSALLSKASDTAGKFYVYDVYDTCGNDQIKGGSTATLDELRATYSAGGGPVLELAIGRRVI